MKDNEKAFESAAQLEYRDVLYLSLVAATVIPHINKMVTHLGKMLIDKEQYMNKLAIKTIMNENVWAGRFYE
jgi:hypothetical protein